VNIKHLLKAKVFYLRHADQEMPTSPICYFILAAKILSSLMVEKRERVRPGLELGP